MAVKRINLLLLIIALHIPSYVLSTTWYVHPDSGLNSIQSGLDYCGAHDTVFVGPGIYYENIDWPYVEGINLISEYGPETTIIDGNQSANVIHLSLMSSDSTTLIHGFTIRNGNAWLGGGIYSVGGRPTISGNIITNNTSQWPRRAYRTEHRAVDIVDKRDWETEAGEDGPPPQGGGIYTEWSSAVIIDNVITDNSATANGGGIACFCDAANISPTILDNTITNNTAHTGGGVYIDCPFTMTVIKENMISLNTAIYGGGIACYYVFQPLLTISKNVITENSADSAGGGIWCYLSSFPIIDSCIISGNLGDGIYSDYYSSPLIFHNNITNNMGFGVRNNDQEELVIAEDNWWGDASGPYHPTTNPNGLGDPVSDFVDYDPWMTSPGTRELTATRPNVGFLQISPNPFCQKLQIRFTIQDSRSMIEKQQLNIYDAGGRLVKYFNLESCIMDHVSTVRWDGTDRANRSLPGGVYFLRLEGGDYTETKKIIFSK
jgi:parallel beta-helix repeat protein